MSKTDNRTQPWEQNGFLDVAAATGLTSEIRVTFLNGDTVDVPWSLLGKSPATSVEVDEDALGVLLRYPNQDPGRVSASHVRALTDPDYALELRRLDAAQSKRVGLRLKALREDRGLGQKDLAALTGMSSPQLSKIESGAFDLRISTAQTLLRAMNASFADLSGPDAPELSRQTIRKRLAASGFAQDAFDRMADHTSRGGLIRLLQYTFGWTADQLSGIPLGAVTLSSSVKFKSTKISIAPNLSSPMIKAAETVALAAIERCRFGTYSQLPSDPKAIRRVACDATGRVTLSSLCEWLWNNGVPVVPLHGKGTFAAAAMNLRGTPVVVLKESKDLQCNWLFDLGHEVGHLALNHLDAGMLIDVDSPTPSDSSDPVETAANLFALQLLLPDHEALIRSVRTDSKGSYLRFKDAVANVAQTANVSPGLLGMVAAFALPDIGEAKDRWGSATNLAKVEQSGRPIVQAEFSRHHDTGVTKDEQSALLEALVLSA